jgi:hypothetical protein
MPTDNLPNNVRPGIYKHFKGNFYEVIGIGLHSETQEPFVIYRALYGEYQIWVRPAAMFLEHVIKDGYDGPRFTLVKEF